MFECEHAFVGISYELGGLDCYKKLLVIMSCICCAIEIHDTIL